MAKETTILVVDDDESMVDLITKLLMPKYKVLTSLDGFDALSKIETLPIDVLITDLQMPAMGGIELIKQVRNKQHDIEIIMITGYGDVTSYIEVMNLGAFEYINKPFSKGTLYTVVDKLITNMAQKKVALTV